MLTQNLSLQNWIKHNRKIDYILHKIIVDFSSILPLEYNRIIDYNIFVLGRCITSMTIVAFLFGAFVGIQVGVILGVYAAIEDTDDEE